MFVVGCGRSGTTLLYHMLLSSGRFAYYRSETHVFNMIVRRFGDLSSAARKRKLMDKWLRSRFFTLSGLDAEEIRAKVLSQCRNGGDFLRIVMGSMAQQQGASRWADCTPAHVLYMREVKKTIPEALFVHIIRDGRDVALSLEKTGWVSPFPWDRSRSLLVAGVWWEWIVNQGRREGRAVGSDYMEVRFEDLVTRPHETLPVIGSFIEHELDYDKILAVGIGSVSKPNTSFKHERGKGSFNPVARWKKRFSKQQLVMFEHMMGSSLRNLGYELATTDAELHNRIRPNLMRAGYRSLYSLKHWTKVNTPLSRLLVDVDLLDQDMAYASAAEAAP